MTSLQTIYIASNCATFVIAAGAAWLARGKQARDFKEKYTAETLKSAALHCVIGQLRTNGFHLARTVKELEKRLSHAGQKREPNGRFSK